MSRKEYFQRERDQYLWSLRRKLIDAKIIGGSKKERKALSPEYTSLQEIKKAIEVANKLPILLEYLPPETILNLFNSIEGIETISVLALKYEIAFMEGLTDEVLLDAFKSQKLVSTFHFIESDSDLLNWALAETPLEDYLEVGAITGAQKLALFNYFRSNPNLSEWFDGVLDVLLQVNNIFRPLLLRELSFKELRNVISSRRLYEFRTAVSSNQNGKILYLLLNGGNEGVGMKEERATWGQRLMQLDAFNLDENIHDVDYHYWEIYLASLYAEKHGMQLQPLHLAKQQNELSDMASSVQEEHIFERKELGQKWDGSINQYKAIDRMESRFHPVAHLYPLAGVEAEVMMSPHVSPQHYELLRRYVVRKGFGGQFEMSAAPVRRIETLQMLYERLFNFRFIDLLWTHDYSLHLNSETLTKSLTIETLSALDLTGKLSQGRENSDIASTLFDKKKDLGRYWEWKQGDLIYPEIFLYGLQIWQPLSAAQLAYEEVSRAFLLEKEQEFWSGQVNFRHLESDRVKSFNATLDNFCSRVILTAEQIMSVNVSQFSPEKAELALLYAEFRIKMREFLEGDKSTKEIYLSKEILSGTREGMNVLNYWLMTVFPTLSSFRSVDLSEMSEEALLFIPPEKRAAFRAVSFGQKITNEIMHRVHRISARAEEEYLELLRELAIDFSDQNQELIIEKFIPLRRRFPCGQKQIKIEIDAGKVEINLHKATFGAILKLIHERLEWMLESPSLADEDRNLFSKAIEQIQITT